MTASAAPVAAPPGEALNRLIWGFAVSQAVFVAARLAIADLLRDGPQPPDALAAATGTHEPTLRRLLRALTAVDLLAEDADGCFAATPTGVLLQSDHPQSMRPFALMMGEAMIWRPWGDLQETIRTSAPAFDRLYGEPFFSFLSHQPHEAAAFNAAMSGLSRRGAGGVLAAYDFGGLGTIVDVGGGQGVLLREILSRYPQTRGVLFDLPSVVEGAGELRDSPVAARCEFAGGDMFQAVPAGGDAYLLRHILHDWSDEESVAILRNCRRCIAPGGRLLAVEAIVKPVNQPDGTKWADLMMLVTGTGRERTEAEFRELYASAGFTLTRVIPAGGTAIIEGIPG